MGWPGGLVEGARASHKVYGAPPSTTLLEAHTRVRDDTTSLAETENSWAEGEIHATYIPGAELARRARLHAQNRSEPALVLAQSLLVLGLREPPHVPEVGDRRACPRSRRA